MICDNCMNNPKNNPYASGFCNCALPAMERGTGWFVADRTQTEKRFTTSNFTTGKVKEFDSDNNVPCKEEVEE